VDNRSPRRGQQCGQEKKLHASTHTGCREVWHKTTSALDSFDLSHLSTPTILWTSWLAVRQTNSLFLVSRRSNRGRTAPDVPAGASSFLTRWAGRTNLDRAGFGALKADGSLATAIIRIAR
jgi:hypothetical protein